MPVRPYLSCPAGSGNRRRRSWTRIRKICVIGNYINSREKRPVAAEDRVAAQSGGDAFRQRDSPPQRRSRPDL